MNVLAQMAGYSIVHYVLIAIVVCAAIAILLAVLRHFQIAVPPVIVYIFWVVIVAFVAIVAVIFLSRMAANM